MEKKSQNIFSSSLKNKFIKPERGASLVGYGLVVGLISVVALGAMGSIGDGVSTLFGKVGNDLDAVVAEPIVPAGPDTTTVATFSTAGSNSYTIPTGCTSLEVKAWGAGSGAAGAGAGGAGGAFILASVSVTPGESLTVNIGGGGAARSGNMGGIGGFNGGGNGGDGDFGGGGGGGGRTELIRTGTDILIAGGAGGGGRGGGVNTTRGGEGGLIGGAGFPTGSGNAGGGNAGVGGVAGSHLCGGTSIAATAGGVRDGGSGENIIGSCGAVGGGGGGGGYGGGGGGHADSNGGGGGGGSLVPVGGTVESGSGGSSANGNPGGTTDPDWDGTAGVGGATSTDSGADGAMILSCQ